MKIKINLKLYLILYLSILNNSIIFSNSNPATVVQQISNYSLINSTNPFNFSFSKFVFEAIDKAKYSALQTKDSFILSSLNSYKKTSEIISSNKNYLIAGAALGVYAANRITANKMQNRLKALENEYLFIKDKKVDSIDVAISLTPEEVVTYFSSFDFDKKDFSIKDKAVYHLTNELKSIEKELYKLSLWTKIKFNDCQINLSQKLYIKNIEITQLPIEKTSSSFMYILNEVLEFFPEFKFSTKDLKICGAQFNFPWIYGWGLYPLATQLANFLLLKRNKYSIFLNRARNFNETIIKITKI